MVKADGQARFTGDEDRALEEIMIEADERQPGPREDDPKVGRGPNGMSWKQVADALAQRGFAKRSPHSVRNHYIRRLKAQRSCAYTKNMCRKCGQPMRGHVCLVTKLA